MMQGRNKYPPASSIHVLNSTSSYGNRKRRKYVSSPQTDTGTTVWIESEGIVHSYGLCSGIFVSPYLKKGFEPWHLICKITLSCNLSQRLLIKPRKSYGLQTRGTFFPFFSVLHFVPNYFFPSFIVPFILSSLILFLLTLFTLSHLFSFLPSFVVLFFTFFLSSFFSFLPFSPFS